MSRISRPMRIWLLLIALTAVTTLVAEQFSSRIPAIGAIFVIAAVKAELVIDHYMEARRADPHWIAMYLGWVAGVTVLLVWGHS